MVLSASRGVAGVALPVCRLHDGADSYDARERFADCALSASAESEMLGLAPFSRDESSTSTPVLPVLVVGSSGVALHAGKRADT